jgi:preprotein translocase subunit Sec61beta
MKFFCEEEKEQYYKATPSDFVLGFCCFVVLLLFIIALCLPAFIHN